MSKNTRRLGPVELQLVDPDLVVEGTNVAGRPGDGRARVWTVGGPDGLLLAVEDVLWQDGAREVRCTDAHSSGPRFTRLTSGLRLGVHRHRLDRWQAQLRIARLKDNVWSNAYKTDAAEIEGATGLEPTALLRRAGADVVGTAEVAYGESGRRRHEFAVSFRGDESDVPVVGWCLTRVLPLLNGHA